MASIKELKKDIDFLASELISECYFRMMMIENADNSALAATVSKALNFRNEFINRANHPDGKENAKMVKAYYRNLRKDLLTQFSAMAEGLARH